MIVKGYVRKRPSLHVTCHQLCATKISGGWFDIGIVGNVEEDDEYFYFTAKMDQPVPNVTYVIICTNINKTSPYLTFFSHDKPFYNGGKITERIAIADIITCGCVSSSSSL